MEKSSIRDGLRFSARLGSVFLGLCLLVWLLGQLTWFLSGGGKVTPQKLATVAALEQQLSRNISTATSPLNIDTNSPVGIESSFPVRAESLPRPTESSDTRASEPSTRLTDGTNGVHSVAEWSPERGRDFKEAPMLRKQAEAGELPPVAERLPENPLVIIPPDQTGPYGGTWARFATGPSDIGIYRARLSYDGLVRWGPMGQQILPNLASRWEIADEGRTYTFWLRKGVRWSDGRRFSVDDILFWYAHVLQNPELTPTIPQQFQRGGEPMEVEKVDEYTVRFRFKTPYGLFLKVLASGRSYQVVEYPAHYLKQYHPDFVPKERLEEMAKVVGFDLWFQLFEERFEWRNPDAPRLWPWIVKKPPPAQPALFERNPYYWKVDPEGNQLPYIDQMTFEIYDSETINLKAINGEMGMQGRHLQFDNYPLFTENSKFRDYRVAHWMTSGGGTSLGLNLNHKDPVLREIIGDRRFRIALSHAINRDELNELAYFGVAEPRQVAPPPISPFYDADYERAYIEYNPNKANQLLDEMGLNRRNRAGVRLRPDGKPLHLRIEIASVFLSTPMFELIAKHWTEVGVKTELKLEARQLFYTRKAALMHDVGVWGSADELIPVIDPRWFFPYSQESIQGIGYARWFTSNGRQGEIPPPELQRCMKLYRQIEATPDEAEQVRLFKKIIDLNHQHLWVIGTVGRVPSIFLVKNTFRNVPKVAVAGWIFRTPGNTAPECYAIEGK